ncbi:hypothetical protein Acr_00g0011790 [Actinidia rufa]|uniref:Transmembrane protein n=1 Tax=Actinidia rufa TaxID=165716 RepID=A0A7J0D9J1_9ERIC|nr:hypothetical protein Acr_00g0011790 [Actinidia rufa]
MDKLMTSLKDGIDDYVRKAITRRGMHHFRFVIMPHLTWKVGILVLPLCQSFQSWFVTLVDGSLFGNCAALVELMVLSLCILVVVEVNVDDTVEEVVVVVSVMTWKI